MKKPVPRLTVDGLESATDAARTAAKGALDAVAEPLRKTGRTGRTVARAAAAQVTREVTRIDGRIDGRAARWTQHRAERREELIDAAIEAVEAHGTEAGMDQIAAAAGTSKPVIYRYFADKNELYRAVGERVVGQIVTALQAVRDDAHPQATLRAAIEAYLQLVEDKPQLFRFVTQNRLLSESRPGEPSPREFSSAVSALLTEALAAQLRAAGIDPEAAEPWGEATVGFIRAASLWWLERPTAMTRQQLTDYLAALLWGGAAGVYQSAGHELDARPPAGVFVPLPR